MYVDETGNSDMDSSDDPNHRYLSLTGIILNLDYVRLHAKPRMESAKYTFFAAHPDDPLVFHRKEILEGEKAFRSLKNAEKRAGFNAWLLTYLTELEYVAITSVIDKKEHKDKEPGRQRHPYHYCMEVLVERFCYFLRGAGAMGDVMAEARGGKEDRFLAEAYAEFYESGTSQLDAKFVQRWLTTKQLKIKDKKQNVCGLQIADLIAHPSAHAVRQRYNGESFPACFGDEIKRILHESKYYRRNDGTIAGFGMKFLK